MGSRITSSSSEGGRAVHVGKGVPVRRSPHRQRGPDMEGRSTQATLPEGHSTRLGHRDGGSESHRGARCGKTARRDLCGGRRVTGVPTATATNSTGEKAGCLDWNRTDFFCSYRQLKKPSDLGAAAKIVCDKMNLTMH